MSATSAQTATTLPPSCASEVDDAGAAEAGDRLGPLLPEPQPRVTSATPWVITSFGM